MKRTNETTKYQEQWNTAGNLKLELEEMDKLQDAGMDGKGGYKTISLGGFLTILCC